jgi:hypothetical protein
MTIEKGQVHFGSTTEAVLYLSAAFALGYVIRDVIFNLSKASN